ncbi:MAG TPA: hypothetical protein VFB58_17250 [Chloroflexota bacterium]|nr:hypothetical protein [Chloroflexota bacterium]
MSSSLFRRETARHLRELTGPILDHYLAGRMSWLSAHMRPNPGDVQSTLDKLASAVELNDPAIYQEYARNYVDHLLEGGAPPVAILAASSLFEDAVLSCVTDDQRPLIAAVLSLVERERAQLLSDRVRQGLSA